jgi:hypothetical protein
MTSEEITGTEAVWDQGLSVRQRQLRTDQRRRTRLLAGVEVVIGDTGADATVYYGGDGQEDRRHVDFTTGDVTHHAATHVLALFAGADGRLLHGADFAPALRSALFDDARRLRDELNANQGPHLWTVRQPWVVEWLDERMRAGYSAPYRNTIYQSTSAIKDKERLFSGEPDPEPGAIGARTEEAPTVRTEYVYVRELLAAKLEADDARRVMGFVDRIARERGSALSGLMKAREATVLALETFAASSRGGTDGGRRALAATTPALPAMPVPRPAAPPTPGHVGDRSRGAQRSGPA